MGWFITLGVLFLLAVIPLGVSIRYDTDGARILVIVGPARFTVFPRKKKEERPKIDKPKDRKKAKKPSPAAQTKDPSEPAPVSQEKEKPKAGGSVLDFLPLAETALKFVAEFFGKTLHVDKLYLKIVLAGDDPCDLAVNYGKAWVALGNLWPRLEEMLTIKKRVVQVECDFEGSETLITACADITLTLGRLLPLVLRYGVRAIKQYLKIMKIRKGGAAI